MRHDEAPFPLDGGRAGDEGVAAALARGSQEAAPPLGPDPRGRARTPTQPSLIEGEGFAKGTHVRGAVGRARSLRRRVTAAEKKLWESLRTPHPRFRRQAPIGPYIVDFACHRAALVVELDGLAHDREAQQIHDAIRTSWLEREGYRVVRFTNRQAFEQPDVVLSAIAALLSKAP